MNIISALKQVEIYYHLYLHERFTLDFSFFFQIFSIVYILHILTQMFLFGFSWLLQYPCLLAACRMVSAWPTHHQPSHPCSLRMLRLHWPLNLVQIWMKCWHILHGWVSFPENLEPLVNIVKIIYAYNASTLVKSPFLNYRQFLGLGSLVWVPFRCLSDGCHRTESNSSCLFSNESFHWLDTYDGCISNLAIVHRPFPSWSWHRLRNSNMSGLYFWDMSASIERCVWIISTNFHRSVCLIKWLILTIFLIV